MPKSILLFLLFLFFITISAQEKNLAEIIKELGHKDFEKREKATTELILLTATHREEIQKIATETDDLEIKERIEYVLEKGEAFLQQESEANLQKSLKLLDEGKSLEAQEAIEKALKFQKNNINAQFQYIKILRINRKKQKMMFVYESILETYQNKGYDYEDKQLKYAQLLIEEKEFEKALPFLEKLEHTHRFPQAIYKYLAICYEKLNKFELAEKYRLKEYEEYKSSVGASDIAWFYLRTNKSELAQKYLKECETKEVKEKWNNINSILNHIYRGQNDSAQSILQSNLDFVNELIKEENILNGKLQQNSLFYIFLLFYISPSIEEMNIYDTLYEKLKVKDNWPTPILGFYFDKISEENVLKIAKTEKTEYDERKNLCEAYCYIGLKFLKKNDQVNAKKYFELCVEQCVFEYIETTLAQHLLNVLK